MGSMNRKETAAEELKIALGLLVRRMRSEAPSESRELSWTQKSVLARLEKEGRIIFRYVDASGGDGIGVNPNGSLANIAGTCNARGNVVGMMPHPERASEPLLGSDDGKMIFASLMGELGKRV